MPKFRSPRAPEPARDEAELRAIAHAGGESDGSGFLESAASIRHLVRQHPPAAADPNFQGRLRGELVRGARLQAEPRPKRRRWGLTLPLSFGAGVAALAALSLVLAQVMTRPPQAPTAAVQAKASVSGQQQVATTKAITVSFNQPMVEQAVVAGLNIEPAVAYRTSWPNSKTLVISPVDGLAPNVGYVVTIAKPAAKAQSGAQAPANVVIPFGTGDAPTTPEGQVPQLVSTSPVAISTGQTALTYLPNGALLVQSSGVQLLPPPGQIAAASPSPSPTPTESPSPSAPPSPAGGGSGAPSAVGNLYTLDPAVTQLAQGASGALPSPDGQQVAYWAPGASGTLDLEVVGVGGGSAEQLATTAYRDPSLAWLDDGDLLYPDAGELLQVNLAGQFGGLYRQIPVGPSGAFSLSPDGTRVLAWPQGVPTLYQLSQGGSMAAPSGTTPGAAWSPTSTALAFVDQQAGVDSLELDQLPSGHVTTLLGAPPGVQLGSLSFDPSGSYLSYVATAAAGGGQLGVVDVQSGAQRQLGNLGQVSDPVWSPAGGQVSLLVTDPSSGVQTVTTLLLSGTPQVVNPPQQPAASARNLATELAQIQVAGGPLALTQITALLAPGSDLAPTTLFPGKFQRFYTVSSTATSPGAATYAVQVRLVRVADDGQGVGFLPETVTVDTAGASPVVSGVALGTWTAVSRGPQVLSVGSHTLADGTTVISIEFDSDLDPATVGPQSITLSAGGQPVSRLRLAYSGLTRTVTGTLGQLPAGALTLTVSQPLADIDGTPIQSPFQVLLQPGPPAP